MPIMTTLQSLREAKGMSQRTLSARTGISRGRLRRIEGSGFDQVTFKELKLVSQVLGTHIQEAIRESQDSTDGILLGRSGKDIREVLVKNSGCKISMFFPPSAGLYVAKIFISGGKNLDSRQFPSFKSFFLQGLLGAFQLKVDGQSYEMREGDYLLCPFASDFSLRNPLMRDCSGFLVALPAS